MSRKPIGAEAKFEMNGRTAPAAMSVCLHVRETGVFFEPVI